MSSGAAPPRVCDCSCRQGGSRCSHADPAGARLARGVFALTLHPGLKTVVGPGEASPLRKERRETLISGSDGVLVGSAAERNRLDWLPQQNVTLSVPGTTRPRSEPQQGCLPGVQVAAFWRCAHLEGDALWRLRIQGAILHTASTSRPHGTQLPLKGPSPSTITLGVRASAGELC